MPNIEDKFYKETISKEKMYFLQKNTKVLESIKPLCESLRAGSQKTRSYYSIYDLQLERLSRKLEEIELKNRRLQMEIRNKTAVFEMLKDMMVNSQINEEYFDVMESGDLRTSEGLARIEQALFIFNEYQSEDFDIRIVKNRKSEIASAMKMFFKRFRNFFEELLESIESSSEGQLRVHSFIYEKVKKLEFIFKLTFANYKEEFINLSSLYSKYIKVIYYSEFERHLSIIQKMFSEKKTAKVSEGLGIFIESFFMIVKCEVHFCKTRIFFGEDVVEFVANIFKEVFSLVLSSFRNMFKLKGLSMICALNKDFLFDFQGEEKEIWLGFLEEVRNLRAFMKKEFLSREEDDLSSRSRVRNLDRCIEHIKICNDLDITEKLIEMIKSDISRGNKEDLEDLVHTLKLFYKLRESLKGGHELDIVIKEINEIIDSRLKDLEKEGIGYIFGGDSNKMVKRTKKILKIIENSHEILNFFKNVVLENSNDEQRRELQTLF